MKRFIAVFGVIVIITMHCLSFYPAKAAINTIDYGEMLNIYLGAAETAMAASQGVTIDWSSIDLPAGSDTWTDQEKAQYIVQYVGTLKKVGQHAIYEWLFGEGNDTQDIISAETSAIGLSNNSNINTMDIKAQLDNILATQSQNHIFQRYSDKVIARWNEYNTNYINDYLDLMNKSDNALPDPPISSNVNVTIFHWAYSSYTAQVGVNYDFSLWYGQQTFNANYPAILGRVDDPSGYVVGANLTSSNSNVIYNSSSFSGHLEDFTIDYPGLKMFENAVDYINGNWIISSEALIYLQTGISSSDIDKGINFSLPDAVIDNSSEDGKIVAHPIYYPDILNTDKAIDIDLDKVVDAIASRIAQGDTDITFDDLVDAGAAVKLDGTTLTDAETIVKDVSVPITRAKVDTIDGVVPTIDVVPPLPPLPPLTPGDYSGEGFNGMSVLARIINATVQGLPEPLILTFFGVVFGAVILGIIKILHH